MGQSKKPGSLSSPLSNIKCVYTIDSPSQLSLGTWNKSECKIQLQFDWKDYLDVLHFLILSGKKCESLGQTSSSAFALGRLAFMHACIHRARQPSGLCTDRHTATGTQGLFSSSRRSALQIAALILSKIKMGTRWEQPTGWNQPRATRWNIF